MDGRSAQTGSTLIELLLVLAMVAVVITWSAPSLRDAQLNSRRAAAVNAFLHTLFSARSESLVHVQYVSVCASRDQQQCSDAPADWSLGWISFINRDHDQPARVDPGETLVARHGPVQGIRIIANRESLVFRHDSFSGTTASFFFCDERGGAFARAVIVSNTGRPRLAESDAYGKRIRCDPAR